MYRKTCLLFYFFVTLVLWGQESKYWTFDNVNLGTGASVISCFFQDSQGLIWAGSDKGLFSYDGYSVKSHFSVDTKNNTQIYCGVIIKSKLLYLGSDNGILIYNITTDKYVETPVNFPTDVRTMSLQGDTLWIGTLKGLYSFNLISNKLNYFDVSTYTQLPHETIYAIITTQDNQVYVGTYDGFCRYLPGKDTFEKIELPINPEKNNQFINTLLEDPLRQCIWIGMEGSLLKYDLQNGTISQLKDFQDNSVKSLTLDGHSHLLAATDNGLYVYSEQQALQHVIHDSRNQNSLSNNIIWSVFTDQDQNIWLGTNYGISLSRSNKAFQYVPISEISGTGDGNQFYSIFKDSRDNYWFGGTNGIIRVNKKNGNWSNAKWYSTESKKNPLPHGRIRHIYEDSDAQLWIASDGNVCRYDYIKQQFIPYNIVDSTGTYSTNWAYHIFEDNQKQLWIATCLGGIFVVDKAGLMEHKKGAYIANYNYTTQNGLSGMFINQIIPDQIGNVWVLLYNNGI
nr:hybrid sensor histidine kinase/response regulator [Bacteroidales bacterium]